MHLARAASLALAFAACSSAPPSPPRDPIPTTPEPIAPESKTAPPPVCIDASSGGYAEGLALVGTVLRYSDFEGHTAGFDVVSGTFVPAPPEPDTTHRPDVTLADDGSSATICAPDGSDCHTVKPDAPITAAVLDRARGIVFLGLDLGDKAPRVDAFEVVGNTRVATRTFKRGWSIASLSLVAPPVIEVNFREQRDDPRDYSELVETTKLTSIKDTKPYYGHGGGFSYVVRDPATGKVTNEVDLWPLYAQDELSREWWAAPSYSPQGPTVEEMLPNGEVLVTAVGGSVGTLALIDPAKGQIVRVYHLPLCGAVERLQCLPAGVELAQPMMTLDVYEACAGEECYAFDVATKGLVRRARSRAPDDFGAAWGMPISAGYDGPPTCSDEPMELGGTVTSFAYSRGRHDAYIALRPTGDKPTTLARYADDDCKADAKVVVGTKEHPCATALAIADAVLVKTNDCKGAAGPAFIVDGQTLKRIAAVEVGQGEMLAAFMVDDLAAFATGTSLSLQHVSTGKVYMNRELPDRIDALWSSPLGDVIVQSGLTFTRIARDGKVGATTMIERCE